MTTRDNSDLKILLEAGAEALLAAGYKEATVFGSFIESSAILPIYCINFHNVVNDLRYVVRNTVHGNFTAFCGNYWISFCKKGG